MIRSGLIVGALLFLAGCERAGAIDPTGPCFISYQRCSAATWHGCGGEWPSLDPKQPPAPLEGGQGDCYDTNIRACDDALESCESYRESQQPQR